MSFVAGMDVAKAHNGKHPDARFFVWWTDDLTNPGLGAPYSFVVVDKIGLTHRQATYWCDAPQGEPVKPGLLSPWAGMKAERAVEICEQYNRNPPV